MELIDKAAIVAEIERQQRKLCVLSLSNNVELRRDAAIQNGVYCSLLSFIDTLEVKEVDLEKEIDKIDDVIPGKREDIEYIAKHFFELGIKVAQKGRNTMFNQ